MMNIVLQPSVVDNRIDVGRRPSVRPSVSHDNSRDVQIPNKKHFLSLSVRFSVIADGRRSCRISFINVRALLTDGLQLYGSQPLCS